MKNKILIVAFLLMASASAWADSFTFGNLKYTVIDSANRYVSVCKGEVELKGELVIPSKVENAGVTYTVTSISENAFSYCSSLTITIPNSVTTIGENAFCLVKNIVYSGRAEGSPWGALNVNAIPDKEGFIYSDAEKTHLTAYIGNGGDVVIPDAVISIGEYAFYECTKLKSVTIPNSVICIGEYAFKFSDLTSISIGNSVKTIGRSAFEYCGSVKKVEFSSIESSLEIKYEDWYSNPMDYGSFLYINGKEVTELIIPNTIKRINDYAFMDCLSLTSVVIGDSVKSIGSYAFADCYNLTSVVIGDSVKSIGNGAFTRCSLTSISIPNSVVSIGNDAFYLCYEPAMVIIPETVSTIGNDAFFRVKNVVYSGDAKGSPWGALAVNGIIDGDFVYSDAEKTHLTVYIGDGGDVVIPDAVISIGEYAFYDCPNLKSVTIQNSVISIGEFAFYGCSGLTSISIPNSVTSIGEYAFHICSGLVSVTIPNTVDTIGYRAFAGCTATIYCDVEKMPSGWSISWNGNQRFEEYKGKVIWKTPSPVTETAANVVSIYAYGRSIVVENAAEEISVYDAMGRLVCRDAMPCVRKELQINTPGLYIVNVGGVAKRVMVK